MITIGCGVSDVFEQLDVSALRQPGLKSFGWERWLCLNSWDANIIQNTFQWVDLTIQTRMSWSVVYWCNCIWRQIVLRISHFLQIPGFTTTTITTTSTTTSFFNVSSPISPQIFLAQEHTSSGRKKTQDRLSVSSVDFASEIGCWIRLYIYIYAQDASFFDWNMLMRKSRLGIHKWHMQYSNTNLGEISHRTLHLLGSETYLCNNVKPPWTMTPL